MSELPKFEIYLYFFIWIIGVSVSLYRLFLIGQVFDHGHHDKFLYEDFRKGWALLGDRFQDQADFEWNTWTSLVIKLTPFLLINILGAECIKSYKFLNVLPLWYTGTTISFLLYHFNITLMFWFLFQTLIYCIILCFKSYLLIWAVSFIIIHYLKPEVWFSENENDQYIIMVSSSWMVLRCISYSVDKLNQLNSEKLLESIKISDIFILLSYSFYLPTMFCGPFISFLYFEKGIQIKSFGWTYKRFFKILKDFLRCTFWFFFTLFALHFIYVNAILLRPEFVKILVDWELAGLGIAMGHFFHLKYTVFYGVPCAWASAEGFTTPSPPCCVSRIHLYSYMWRRFDHGLYQFLVRYIYVPVISVVKGKSIVRKTTASIVCFIFMFVWHGGQDFVFFWVLFNFIAVTIELVVKQLCNFTPVHHFLNRHISPQNQIRLQCLLAAPLDCFSMISNYFFIGNGMEIGFIYLDRIIHGSLASKFTILFFLYGAGQSAVAIQKWENQKTKNKTT